MAAGLGHLRLSPRDFWCLTPRELAAALKTFGNGSLASEPPAYADLEALMARFPD